MTNCQSVLIVDHDARLADTFAIALRRVGFEARTARNGVQGYSSYFCDPTDWVITDIEMKELDGIEMMRCLRAINPTVKTIYTSAAARKNAPALSTESRQFGAKVFAQTLRLEPFDRADQRLAAIANSQLLRKSPPQLYGNAFARSRQEGQEIAGIMRDYHKRRGHGCGTKLGI